jgi:hypothetical protein
MTAAAKVLVIGGYGVFGGRLIQLLEDEPRLNLLVAGRSTARAGAFVRSRGKTAAELTPIAFDRSGDLAGRLAAIRPDIVVDASGPFQAYGGDRYRVVQACVTQRVNYLDLADGSDFVAGIGAFDSQARAAGIYILSGVSSFPVLTAAAVRRLSVGMTAVKAIRGGIAPSPYAGVGQNVIRAIAGYAGKPIRRKRAGAFGVGYPWTEHLRYTVAVPGMVPLGDRLFSLVDVPDLQALATLWPDVEEIWMAAAPVPETLHRALAALAWLVRLRLLPTLAPIAPLMHAATPDSLGRAPWRHVRRRRRRRCVARPAQAELASPRRGRRRSLDSVHGYRDDRPQHAARPPTLARRARRDPRIGARGLPAVLRPAENIHRHS